MSFGHLTLPTKKVEQTARFIEETLGYSRDAVPDNVPDETVWLNIGRGQQIHVFYVEGFEVSPFEREFGRHIALFHPVATTAHSTMRSGSRGTRTPRYYGQLVGGQMRCRSGTGQR